NRVLYSAHHRGRLPFAGMASAVGETSSGKSARCRESPGCRRERRQGIMARARWNRDASHANDSRIRRRFFLTTKRTMEDGRLARPRAGDSVESLALFFEGELWRKRCPLAPTEQLRKQSSSSTH